MKYKPSKRLTYAKRRPSLLKVKPIRVYYCPKCVDEQIGCPYHFAPIKCPEHPDTRLIFDKELSENLTKEAQKEMAEALKRIYEFSAKRRFKYGLNERYIPVKPEILKQLFKQGYIFYKKARGNKYWLPTIKGRQAVESLSMRYLDI